MGRRKVLLSSQFPCHAASAVPLGAGVAAPDEPNALAALHEDGRAAFVRLSKYHESSIDFKSFSLKIER